MVKKTVTIQEAVEFLNEILKTDPAAISAFFNLRIGCNEKLANHKTVQVGVIGKNYFIVGMIGILNGLFGADEHGWGHISINCEDGKIIEFELLTSERVSSFIKNKLSE